MRLVFLWLPPTAFTSHKVNKVAKSSCISELFKLYIQLIHSVDNVWLCLFYYFVITSKIAFKCTYEVSISGSNTNLT